MDSAITWILGILGSITASVIVFLIQRRFIKKDIQELPAASLNRQHTIEERSVAVQASSRRDKWSDITLGAARRFKEQHHHLRYMDVLQMKVEGNIATVKVKIWKPHFTTLFYLLIVDEGGDILEIRPVNG